MKHIVFAVHTDGSPLRHAAGLAGAARAAGAEKITCLVFGPGSADAAGMLNGCGAHEILYSAAPETEALANDALAFAAAQYIKKENPGAVLFGAGPMDKAWAARTAALLGCGLTADAVQLSVTPEGKILAVKPTYGGRMLAEIASSSPVQMLTIRDGYFPPAPRASAAAAELKTDFTGFKPGIKQISLKTAAPTCGVDITEADAVIAVGKGVSKENLELVKQLSALTGWAIGATRPVVDEGLVCEEAQIGITGRTIKPKLYLGLGISGKMHHTRGMTGSKTIVAVNKDPKAQIREIAHLFIEADVKDFLPAFIAEVKRIKGVA